MSRVLVCWVPNGVNEGDVCHVESFDESRVNRVGFDGLCDWVIVDKDDPLVPIADESLIVDSRTEEGWMYYVLLTKYYDGKSKLVSSLDEAIIMVQEGLRKEMRAYSK